MDFPLSLGQFRYFGDDLGGTYERDHDWTTVHVEREDDYRWRVTVINDDAEVLWTAVTDGDEARTRKTLKFAIGTIATSPLLDDQ